MRPVQITIGSVAFDHADYDARNDVLYLHIGEPQEAEGEETPEGHVLRCAPGSQRIVGLTVLGAQRILDRDGELRVTIPGSVTASADDLAPALAESRTLTCHAQRALIGTAQSRSPSGTLGAPA
jgi:uncharacterized protein YuzE